jgi:hypothetical protein
MIEADEEVLSKFCEKFRLYARGLSLSSKDSENARRSRRHKARQRSGLCRLRALAQSRSIIKADID